MSPDQTNPASRSVHESKHLPDGGAGSEVSQETLLHKKSIASSDLLVGRLALVHCLIDRATLDAAVQEQTDHPQRSLAEVLVATGAITDEQRQFIEGTCQQHLAKYGDDSDGTFTWSPSAASLSSTTSRADAVSAALGRASGIQPSGMFGGYELLGEMARGGMGVVYKARQVRLNRPVALKMIRSGELADPEQVQRFYSEARAAARLDHPGIVPVYEVGEVGGQHYYSMALVPGASLNERVKSGGPLLPREAARLLRSVAEAVQFAHENGIVHRDVKPQNVLLDDQGHARVTDFGLAKHTEMASELTRTGQIIGTPSYMPPEQAAGRVEEIGPAADVYSLGATLYFVLSGRPPFQTASTAETIRQVLEAEPVPPRRLNPAIPRDLETVCLKCLRKEPDNRYATAAALADDLARWLESKPIVARRVSRAEKAWLWCKRRPAVAGLAAAVLLIVAVGSLVFIERQNSLRATGLAGRLLDARLDEAPAIAAQLGPYRRWANPQLRAVLDDPQATEPRKLRAAMGLLETDSTQAERLLAGLLAADPDDARVLVIALEGHRAALAPKLWTVLEKPGALPGERLRATLALAAYDPPATGRARGRWDKQAPFLAQRLLAEARQNPSSYEPLVGGLEPAAAAQIEPLGKAFRDIHGNATERELATAVLARYAAGDAQALANLAMDAQAAQWGMIYPVLVKQDAKTKDILRAELEKRPPANAAAPARVALARRQAAAAAALLQAGEREKIFSLLRVKDDPESLTQFVHRGRARGVLPPQLLDCVRKADALRQASSGEDRRLEDRVLFGLLLALGEFELADLPQAEQKPLLQQVLAWYGQDASSAIHGAAGWILRRWGQEEAATKVDHTPVPYDPQREWYTLEIKAKTGGPKGGLPREEPIYFTFVVFPPGEFQMGSPEDEAAQNPVERQHRVRLTRPLAVSDREITWAQYSSFDGGRWHDAMEKQWMRKCAADEPAFGVDWYGAVRYCRWLSEQAKLTEAEQCYADPQTLEKGVNGEPRNWPLDLDKGGFRLPTEAEWEYACRSGTTTRWSFGSDAEHLAAYAWFLDNSQQRSHPAGRLGPNLRGLFDVHGNLFEWTHDSYERFGVELATDPLGPQGGLDRILRGGGWVGVAETCRSASRGTFGADVRSRGNGFRLALSPVGRDEGRGRKSNEGG